MAVVDVLVLGILAVGLVVGLLRGFLIQVTGLAGIIGGLYLAYRYEPVFRQHVVDRVLHTQHNAEIGFVTILLATVLLVALLGLLIRRVVARLELGAYDRLLGGVFGVLKASLICSGILLAILMIAPRGSMAERTIGSSKSAPILWHAMDRAASVLPTKMQKEVRKFLDDHAPPSAPGERTPAPASASSPPPSSSASPN